MAALVMNSLVFPRHSRVRARLSQGSSNGSNLAQVYFLSDTSRTLGLLTDLYLALSQ